MSKKYPLTYKEYEEKIIELFIGSYSDDKKKIMEDRLGELLDEDPYFIQGLYEDTCFRYDRRDLYGDTSNVFDEYHLNSIPVNTLEMLLGGNFE